MTKETMTVTGQGASGGLAMGRLFFYRKGKEIPESRVGHNAEQERRRLSDAIEVVKGELILEEKRVEETVGREDAEVFLIHRMMLEDDDLVNLTEGCVAKGHSAEYAVYFATEALAERLMETHDDYMQARATDLRDIGERLLLALKGGSRYVLPQGVKGVILCAEDLTPGETVSLEKGSVAAFVLSHGSGNSHTAILARSMGVPAVVNTGEGLFSLPEGEEALVNADAGCVTVFPDEATLTAYQDWVSLCTEEKKAYAKIKDQQAVSKSGHHVGVYGNVGSAEEAADVLENGGEGIGLFRSEFLYLGKKTPPDEEEQFKTYQKVLTDMASRRVVVRTLDIGADKQVEYLGLAKEENPAMGLRGIRLCFERESLFRTQLRALLRASVFGKLAILFPMIASQSEVVRAKALLCEEAKRLEAEGIPFSYDVEIGVMIETPAAALISDVLAAEVDFFSVGTNDLSQYTLAVDRQNARAAAFFDSHHEAVLRLVAMAAENAHKNGIWIGICGELAADLTLTQRFLDMKIDELSVTSPALLPLKAHLLKLCQ